MKNIPLSETEIKEIKDHYSQELEKIQKRATEIRGILQKIGTSKSAEVAKPSKLTEKKSEKGKKKPVKSVASKTAASVPEKSTQKAETKKTGKKAVKPAAVAKKKTEVKKASKSAALKAKGKGKEKTTKAKAPKKTVAKVSGKVAKKTVTKVSGKVAKKAVKTAKAEIKKAKSIKTKPATGGKKGRKKSADSKKAQYENYVLGLISKQGKVLTSKAIFDAVEKEFKVTAADYSKMKATVTVILSKEKAGGKIKDMNQAGTKAKLYGLTEWFDDKGNLKDNSKL